MADLRAIVETALGEIAQAADLPALEQIRVRVLGKTGVITEQLKALGKLPAAERPAHGQLINDAKQALEIGLVTAIAPPGQLQIRARELAKKVLRQGPLAARLAKVALNASARVDMDSGLLIETLAQALCYSSEDKLEGTTAFLEKRKPKFTGK